MKLKVVGIFDKAHLNKELKNHILQWNAMYLTCHKGGFFSESSIHFLDLQISKKMLLEI